MLFISRTSRLNHSYIPFNLFCSLGSTRAQAGSAAAFEKIDREFVLPFLLASFGYFIFLRYVINAARAAKSDDPAHEQRLVYVSVSVNILSSSLR